MCVPYFYAKATTTFFPGEKKYHGKDTESFQRKF
jgi:hypothetical protein